MTKINNSLLGYEGLLSAEIFSYNHLPVVATYCEKLNLITIINNLLPSKMEIKPDLMVQAMILDTLSRKTPLLSS